MAAGDKYQPSNGSEGCWFMDKFCDNCIHQHPDPNNELQCGIIALTMMLSVNEPDYPTEWTFDQHGNPICTKFKRWDWGRDDDGDWEKPPENPDDEPGDPNQLMLFSVADDVLKNHTPTKKETENV